VVHGLGQHAELLALTPGSHLEADALDGGAVADRGADDEAERFEACLLEQDVLRDGQIGGGDTVGVSTERSGETLLGRLGLVGARG